AEVFAAEAASTLDALDAALAQLIGSLDDRTLLKSIERAFHTLKGAAATVGLAAVSAQAAELQDRAEALADAGRAATAEDAAGLAAGARVARRLAGIAAREVVAEAPAAPPPSGFDEMAAEFEREARVALDEAEHLLGSLRDADPAGAGGIAGELAHVMH